MRTLKQLGMAVMISLALIFFLTNSAQAQVDTTVKKDTVPPPPPTTTTTAEPQPTPKRFVIYAGPNISTLRVNSEELKDDTQTGWHVGLSWRSKGFLFSQFGLRYNSPVFSLLPANHRDSGDHKFSVSAIDIPLTLGINILSATDKVLALRGFISAVPSFNIGVGDNDYGYDKDKIETFNFAGTLGIGVDVLFLVFELGYNYGFIDLLKDKDSKPGQAFLNIGFRF
ncbi:MAG TPA: outer membrane beta-barrel protein [Chitinophagaceae bacterium]|jgi:hypothetical protein|nr:outer membrane beta-barrel protein [Chitinophagaceae bacterium]HZJ61412.1 outer membrane beta-barrel protein [Chitinophagaceae bacterium]